MPQVDAHPSTGLPGLDRVFEGLLPGDNIVWQVDSIDDYLPFVGPYCRSAVSRGNRIVYFRFARHRPLVDADSGVEIKHLHPEAGFELFITEVHRAIQDVGSGGYFLFDCLSELAVDWSSDRMLGNFFMLTCPYLNDHGAIAYFAVLRNHHSFHAISPITGTTQILADVYSKKGRLYVHPLNVQHRHSATMYMLHVWEDDDFLPVTQSATIAEILTDKPWSRLDSAAAGLGFWSSTFSKAEQLQAALDRGKRVQEQCDECFHQLLRMSISRHERILSLAEKYLSLPDVLAIERRMIGTGLIGGKSVGMLLARAILQRNDRRWKELLEPHDSFFIGSDVFYTFLVRSGIWWIRQKLRDSETFLEGAEEARRRILVGTFPEYLEKRFADMLDYFGQSPIIVRSSSLLEDNFGNAFAGKYESVFCANQGSRHKRLRDFISAVRTIYASTMSEKALIYRAQRGMLDQDEQMALLVQRVSGAVYDKFFYPQIAGVGLSFNPYVWGGDIDPEAGVLRLVFALGTRAVDRHDDDYTRVVALNAPSRRPEAGMDEAMQFTQRKVDVLDLEADRLLSRDFSEVAGRSPDLPIEMFASRDEELARRAADAGIKDFFPNVLTFNKLLTETGFVSDMRDMLKTLQTAYKYPVDIEFAANFIGDGICKINLLQCRPFQCKGGGTVPKPPENIRKSDLLLKARGAVIGQSRDTRIDRLIYVAPAAYARLAIADRYTIARMIGRITHLKEPNKPKVVMLIGPGRWGTTSPSLGVPIRFSEINSISVLCEVVTMHESLVPDVSLGTHLFSEMVEMDILYLALFPSKEDNFLNGDFFDGAPNRLAELFPDSAKWAETIRVIDTDQLDGGAAVKLNANTFEQRVTCYVERPAK